MKFMISSRSVGRGRRHSRRRRTLASGAVLALVCAAATACSSSSSATKSTSHTPVLASDSAAPLSKLLPKSIGAKGSITYATLIFPPWISLNGSTYGGMQTEMLDAMGKLLDVNFKPTQVDFNAMIPGVIAGRFDMIGIPVNDTSEREKTINFLDYATDKSEVTVLKGNPLKLTKVSDLCGRRGAATSGTSQQAALTLLNSRICAKNKITILPEPSPITEDTALYSGRADFSIDTYSAEAYALKTATTPPLNKLEIADMPSINDASLHGTFPVGLVVQKSATQLLTALQRAFQQLIDDGTYGKIMAKYNLTALAVKAAETNTASRYGA